MLFRLVSDLHLEFNDNWKLPELETDKDTVLLLAGDISNVDHLDYYDNFFNDICNRFKDIIYIFGNHEYYKGSIKTTLKKYKEYFQKFENLHIFEKGLIEYDDVVVIAATLWTDCNKGDPYTAMVLKSTINDYKFIRIGPNHEPYQRTIGVIDTMHLHNTHLNFIKNNLDIARKSGKKIIVMTHYLPTQLSVAPEYKNDPTNNAFYSELSELIYEFAPDVWCHGHTHFNFDYELYDTRVICNPKGYCVHYFKQDDKEISQNNQFNPLFSFNL